MSELDLSALAGRLRELRVAAGLSVRELADRAGISASYLRVLENGENSKTGKPSRPSGQHVEQLVRALGEDAQDLAVLAGHEGVVAAPASPRPRPASNVPELLADLRQATRDLPKRSTFMYERAVDRLREFDAEFRLLAGGTLQCSSEDEPYVTQLAVRSCRSHLRAVSYEDHAWWGQPPGDIYRDHHVKARSENPELDITRIFLVGPGEREALASTFRWHLELGIQTYVLDLAMVPRRHHEDFVLYDDTLLRTAVPVSVDRKQAEFTDDKARIMGKMVDFDALRRLAVDSGARLTAADVDGGPGR